MADSRSADKAAATQPLPVAQPLSAPPGWHTVDFISDLHLQPDETPTFLAWRQYMEHTPAQAIFILGDLFEVWIGDDAVERVELDDRADDSFELRCARVLMRCAVERDVFFMRGNRDFLVAEPFALACGMRLLEDPTVLRLGTRSWLLSHGDALCLADTAYQRFRGMVRSAAWQQTFLALPLEQRRVAARQLRERSEALKRSSAPLADVDTPEARRWMQTAGATAFIHGHTHRPADHELGDDLQRMVLSDWDLEADPPRAEVLRITVPANGAATTVRRLAVAPA